MRKEQPASKSFDPGYQAELLACRQLCHSWLPTCFQQAQPYCDLGGAKEEGQGSLWAALVVYWERPFIAWPETQIHRRVPVKFINPRMETVWEMNNTV